MTSTTPSLVSRGLHRRVILSFFLTALGLLLAFLPWGWGFITVGTGVLSFILARTASQKKSSRAGILAQKISGVPVIIYAVYMVVVIPTRTTTHTAQARVVSTGELSDSSSFEPDREVDEPVEGVVLDVEPCAAQLIVRTTSVRDLHLDVDIPSSETRSCLASLQTAAKVEIEIEITRRWLSPEVKSFSVSRIGDCTLTDHDTMAVLSSGFCEAWSP